MPRFQPKPPEPPKSDDWRDLRDARGKLCARLDTKRLVLEVRRSDRDLVAQFDLREYIDSLKELENKKDIE